MFFSVIVPLFNKKPHVQRAVLSVLQNLQDRQGEIIIVNDGSTDGSLGLVRAIDHGEIPLHIIDQPNQGVSAARNHGVQQAQGEYLLFLDADDEWMPRHVSTIRELASRYPEAAVFADAHVDILPGGSVRAPAFRACPKPDGILKSYYLAAALGRTPVHSSTVCIKKHAFWDAGGFVVGETQGEDKGLWATLAARYSVAWSATLGSRRYWDAAARSSTRFTQARVRRGWYFFEKASEMIGSRAIRGNERRYIYLYLAKMHYMNLQHCVTKGYGREATKALLGISRCLARHLWERSNMLSAREGGREE